MTKSQFFKIILGFFIIVSAAGCTTSRSNRKPANQDKVYISNANEILTLPAQEFETPESVAPENKKMFFDWPVDEARMTRGFSLDPTGKRRRPHLGIDLAAPKGTRILAAHDGLVVYAGKDFKGFGKMILIEGKNQWATLYAHLTKALVSEGDVVRQGDLIGQMGRTGRASGVHLHFEIRKDKTPVDPLSYLPRPTSY
jgi:murein DD-endopeptidase MepM/ murein hydrolase activator NlpD